MTMSLNQSTRSLSPPTRQFSVPADRLPSRICVTMIHRRNRNPVFARMNISSRIPASPTSRLPQKAGSKNPGDLNPGRVVSR